MNGRSTWVRIAHCRDIPLREGRAVKICDREIAIFNLGERFLAVENRCPHKGGPLADGIVSGATVVCPLHAWKMSLETGKGVNGPSASSCVETFRTRVEGEVVLLELSDMRGRSQADSGGQVPEMCLQANDGLAMTDYPSAAEA
jgi:nitrite reductase (NADH) small subunit